MPPRNAKAPKGNAAKKEQIAEKIKEIQQRQKNWMRQRDQHLKSGPDISVSKDSTTDTDRGQHTKSAARNPDRAMLNGQTSHGVDILKVHHNSSQQFTSQVSDKLNVKVKHGFGAWLQSRKETTDDPDQHANGTQHRETYSAGLDQNNSRILQEEKSYMSSSSLQSSSRSHPLSPAEFDSLADSIASRVKKDLGIKHSSVVDSVNGRHHEQMEMREGSFRGQVFVREERPGMEQSAHRTGDGDGDGEGSVDVSSHRCPFCSTLMTTLEHIPMLLVPCGHTLCKHCSSSHSNCRLCGTRVASLTTNIMLQQIIQEFHRKGQRGVSVAHHPLSEPTWERQGGLPVIPPKTTTKYRDVDYCTQLRSLQDRHETLQEEARSRRRERDHITSKVQRAEKQLNAIQKAEAGLVEQIQQLQDKLYGLRQQKEEYVGEYQQLQEEQKTASDQVSLVERTLKSLEEEIDKVKFLAEGQDDLYQRRIQHR